MWLRQYQIWFKKKTKTSRRSITQTDAISSRLKCASKLEFGYVFGLELELELGLGLGVY